MKRFYSVLLLAGLLVTSTSCKKDGNAGEAALFEHSPRTAVPDELVAAGGKFWTLGTISSINFWDAQSTEYRNAGGIVVFFKFRKDGTYKFLLYVNVSTSTTRDQTWTEVDGTVEIGETQLADGNTYKTIQLHPVKGTDKILTSSQNTTRTISQNDPRMKGSFASKYAVSRYVGSDGRQMLDMLDLRTNNVSAFHEED